MMTRMKDRDSICINNLNKEQFNSIEYGRKVFIVKPDSDSDSKELYLTL